MMRNFFLFVLLFTSITFFAQTVEIYSNPGTTTLSVLGTSNYHVSENIYTNDEIGNTNFTTSATAINKLSLICTTVGTGSPIFNSVKIYMKETTAGSFTAGPFSTAGYTLVFDGTITINSPGWVSIPLSTSFVRTPGSNLQIAIDRSDNTTHAGFVYGASIGNTLTNTATTVRRYNGTTAYAGSNLTTSTFRAAVRLKHEYDNDLVAESIYTLGKLPTPNGTSSPLSATVLNDGANTMNNIQVELDIIGANSYNDVQTISTLAPGARATLTFSGYNPVNLGNNTVTLNVLTPDDFSGNNTRSMTQNVNYNTWSYAYGPTPTGGVGFTGGTGDFVARFNNNLASSISQVSVNYTSGGNSYKIGIWDASGTGGTPGTLLWESSTLTSTTGLNVIPVSPIVPIAVGDFFVGVRQVGTTNVGFAYQTENPIRPNTFYFTSPTGGTTWNDFAPNSPFRFMIEPKVILATDGSISNLAVPNISCHDTATYKVTLTNTGANPITAGNANVILKIGGANTQNITKINTQTLNTGQSEVINFYGVNISNTGNNLDTALLDYTGDLEPANDRQTRNNITAESNPFIFEGFESNVRDIGFVQILAGNRNLTTFPAGSYSNPDITLNANQGTRMVIFDNYSAPNSTGVVNRLYSECIVIPSSSSNPALNFFMSHDPTFSTDLDSLYLSVTEDKGLTWTRIAGFQRPDATLTGPIWKEEVVSLSAYSGKSIQIGFENVSKWGNVIGLDNVSIVSDCKTVINNNTTSVGSLKYAIDCSVDNDTIKFAPNLTTASIQAPVDISKNINIIDQNTPDVNIDVIMEAIDNYGINILPAKTVMLSNLITNQVNQGPVIAPDERPLLQVDDSATLKTNNVTAKKL